MLIPIERAFAAAAAACVGAQEVPAASNAGLFVERCQKAGGGAKGDAWCADFVAMLARSVVGAGWPLPLTGSCRDLAAFATAHGMVVDAPALGDLALIWFDSLRRHGHVLVVAGVLPGVRVVDSISGNTTDPAVHIEGVSSREGWCVARQPWHLGPKDLVVRWSTLLKG